MEILMNGCRGWKWINKWEVEGKTEGIKVVIHENWQGRRTSRYVDGCTMYVNGWMDRWKCGAGGWMSIKVKKKG